MLGSDDDDDVTSDVTANYVKVDWFGSLSVVSHGDRVKQAGSVVVGEPHGIRLRFSV